MEASIEKPELSKEQKRKILIERFGYVAPLVNDNEDFWYGFMIEKNADERQEILNQWDEDYRKSRRKNL